MMCQANQNSSKGMLSSCTAWLQKPDPTISSGPRNCSCDTSACLRRSQLKPSKAAPSAGPWQYGLATWNWQRTVSEICNPFMTCMRHPHAAVLTSKPTMQRCLLHLPSNLALQIDHKARSDNYNRRLCSTETACTYGLMASTVCERVNHLVILVILGSVKCGYSAVPHGPKALSNAGVHLTCHTGTGLELSAARVIHPRNLNLSILIHYEA